MNLGGGPLREAMALVAIDLGDKYAGAPDGWRKGVAVVEYEERYAVGFSWGLQDLMLQNLGATQKLGSPLDIPSLLDSGPTFKAAARNLILMHTPSSKQPP